MHRDEVGSRLEDRMFRVQGSRLEMITELSSSGRLQCQCQCVEFSLRLQISLCTVRVPVVPAPTLRSHTLIDVQCLGLGL
jgi:hypothetical protein